MRSTPSSSISAGSIPATRTSDRRYASSFSFSATAGFWISSRAEVIVCDPEMVRMAWFLNFYKCARCKRVWTDQWSATCDDDCPHCGARHMSPFDSERLTTLIECDGAEVVVYRSPDTAEHEPDYRELGPFPTREQAIEFIAADGD